MSEQPNQEPPRLPAVGSHNASWRLAKSFALVILSLLTFSAESADIDELRWIELAIPADALAVGRVDVAAVLASPLGDSMRRARTETYETIDSFYRDAFGFRIPNVDYFWYAFPIPGAGGGITLLQGEFHPGKVKRRMLGMAYWQSYRYEGVVHASTFLNAAGKPEMAIMLRENLIAIGDLAPMHTLLKKWQEAGSDGVREGVRRVANSEAPIAAAYVNMEVFQGTNPAYALVDAAYMQGMIDEDMEMTIFAESNSPTIAEGLISVALGIVQTLSARDGLARQPMARQLLENVSVTRRDATIMIDTMVMGETVMSQFNRTRQRRPVDFQRD
ncbi:MAG: hypothetical protein O2868_09400 [Proteobacteria bacterium]|jgi:hypothetical protein|nr:hypothetical protein [Pseudomonadota bacterium]